MKSIYDLSITKEEVNKIEAGKHYQFPVVEGRSESGVKAWESLDIPQQGPVYTYEHNAYDRAVIGGIVNRSEMYPELKDKRVGLGVANIVLEFLESTDRFKFTEDKAEIKNKMIAQDKASDKGISSNKIEVKGNVILANYFVYIEVYDFSVSEDEEIKMTDGSKTTQTTRLGLQVRFVDAQTGEIITGSGLGEASTIKTASLLDGLDEIKFNQSTIGTSTKKALETASSRVITKLIKKGVFKS